MTTATTNTTKTVAEMDAMELGEHIMALEHKHRRLIRHLRALQRILQEQED